MALNDGSPRMPEPSFWTFCLVFSHRAVIGQVESLTQVTTEVGRSRAWLRMALNDGLLGSYLAAMGKDQVSLSVHYEKFAFLRDQEMRDLLLNYLTGVEVYTFALSTNVSLLNRWQSGPLVLAGVWAASASAIVEGAEDVVAGLQEEVSSAPAFPRTLAEPIRVDDATLIRRGLLNEDEALRLILASTPVTFSPDLGGMVPLVPDNIVEKSAMSPVDLDTLVLASKGLSPTNLPAVSSPVPSSPSPEPIRSCTVSPTLHWDDTNSCLLAAQSNSLSPNSLAKELDNAAELENSAGLVGSLREAGVPETIEEGTPDCGETLEEMIYSNDPMFEEAYTIECVTVSDEPESIVPHTQPNQVCDEFNQDVEHWKYMAEHERGLAKEEERKEELEQRRPKDWTEA